MTTYKSAYDTIEEYKIRTGTSKPDYQIAQILLDDAFRALELDYTISNPTPYVKDKRPSIQYHVSFRKGEKVIEMEYYSGIGLVKYPKRQPKMIGIQGNEADWQLLRMGVLAETPKNLAFQADTACKLAIVQKVYPKPSEVLACICSEGLDAIEQPFEDWCDSLGYDTDSIKARAIYDSCLTQYHKALSLLSKEQVQFFGELSRNL